MRDRSCPSRTLDAVMLQQQLVLPACHLRGTGKEIYPHNGKQPLRTVKKHVF